MGETSITDRKEKMDVDDPNLLLETIKNAKMASEKSDQLFKTKDEDTSDVDYENYPDYYWDQAEEDSTGSKSARVIGILPLPWTLYT
jgi:hypothetical protein